MKRRICQSLSLALLLSSCATPETPEAASLCTFNLDPPENVRVAHVLKNGTFVPGEINVRVYREWTSEVPSAIARPNLDVLRREVRTDCFNKEGNYWYPCLKVAEADFSDIRGIGRSMTLEQSEKLAKRMCERLTRKRAPRVRGLSQDSTDLSCFVALRTKCPLPEG
ncbi:MAG: hypothetical protein QNJ94_11705 [Alphaproteobacteria bacterium]|nr:hypothetical protein [Alphaproteobacteria bacterium]